MPAGSKAPNGETIATPFYVIRYDFSLQRSQADARMHGVAAE
jgi:hypothetical protein